MKLAERTLVETLKHYAIGDYVSHKPESIAHSNPVFSFLTTTGQYVIRLHKTDEREKLSYQLQLIDCCQEHNVPVPRIIQNNSGSRLTEHDDKLIEIQAYVEGAKPENIGTAIIKDLAKNIAHMNTTLMTDEIAPYSETNASDSKPFTMRLPSDIGKAQEATQKALRELDDSKLRKGHIHGDLSPPNIVIQNEEVAAIIDWEEAHYDHIIKDPAASISHLLVTGKQVRQQDIKTFLREYQHLNPLNKTERTALYYHTALWLIDTYSWWARALKEAKTAQFHEGLQDAKLRIERFQELSLSDWMNLF